MRSDFCRTEHILRAYMKAAIGKMNVQYSVCSRRRRKKLFFEVLSRNGLIKQAK